MVLTLCSMLSIFGYDESAVLDALRDANVALSRYGHPRDNVVSLRNVETSAIRAATLTQQC
jgi:hypothetical protein